MATQLKTWQGQNVNPKAQADVNVQQILTSGTHIASINGTPIYAPNGGGGGGGSVSEYIESVCGKAGIRATKASMSDGEYIALENYPYANTYGECYNFRAKITSFSKIKIGRGTNTVNNAFAGTYRCWLEIDDTNIKIYRNSSALIGTIAHGLTISTFISVNMRYTEDKKMEVTIMTLGGLVSKTINPYTDASSPFWYSDATGMVKVTSDGSVLTDCKLSATNTHFHSPLWIFGASYEQVEGWQSQVRKMGYTNYLINAYPGRNSSACYDDFVRATAFGFPKFLYWTMWGNGSAADLDTYIGQVKALCDAQGTTLIIIQRPNSSAEDVSSTYTARKAAIDKYINMGVRYVDSANALSSNPSSADGWYDGYLSSDGKHPTSLGFKSLAMQVLQDLPEIMQY